MQSWRQVRIVVERTKLDGREWRIGGQAPQRTPATRTEGAPGILAAVALTEVDPGLALRDFERGLRRKGDIVRPAARSLLTVGAVADADTHQWCSDLKSDRATSASSCTVHHGHPHPRFPKVVTGPCCTPQQRERDIVSGRYCQRLVSMATCPSSNRRRSPQVHAHQHFRFGAEFHAFWHSA